MPEIIKSTSGVINSDEEYYRAAGQINDLFDKGDGNRTQEEDKLMDLLADAIEDYDRRNLEPIPEASAIELLQILMRDNNLQPEYLADIFGSEPAVSDVLSGKRAMTKEEAVCIAQRFSLNVETYLSQL